ncbi:MAG TPA: hypothetical protein VHL53_11320 [Acidimicrobiia bacterium]|nr:hypothetical protein [Acidimicrobiia bacterium]
MGTSGHPARTATKRRQPLLLLGVAAALIAAAATGLPPPAEAGGDPPAFVGTAAASGGRVSFVVPGQFAVEEIVDGGGPVAQSKLDALGGDSYAALPYPGGTAVAYQGLFAVATGISSPFAYPAYVSASDPGSPSQEVSDPSGSGAYHLLAVARPAEASALAHFRPGSADSLTFGGESRTHITSAAGHVVALAESLSEGIEAGRGALRISSVRSHATTTWTPGGGPPATDTGLEVDGLRAGGVAFGVGPQGLVVAGQPVPYPAGDVNKVVDGLLAPSGVHLRFVAAEPIAGGARAAALEIVTTTPPGPNGATGTLTVRLGGASSGIAVGEAALPPPPLGAVIPVAPPPPAAGPPVFSPPAGSGAGTPAPSSGARPAGSVPAAALSAPSPFAGGTGDATGEAATGNGAAPAAGTGRDRGATADLAARVVAPRKVRRIGTVYGVLAAAGALMFVLGMAWAGRGDRRWAGSS